MTFATAGMEPAIDFKQLIEDRVKEEFLRHGYSKTAMDGTTVRDDEKMNSIAFPSKGFDDPTEFHHDFPIFRRNGARHRSRADRCV